jgi:hypothetical protein
MGGRTAILKANYLLNRLSELSFKVVDLVNCRSQLHLPCHSSVICQVQEVGITQSSSRAAATVRPVALHLAQ